MDVVSLYGANDLVFDVSSGDLIFGGTGADTMLFTGTVVNTTINAGSGSDSIVMSGTGMTGNSIDLGVGVDTLLFTTETTNDTGDVGKHHHHWCQVAYLSGHRSGCCDYD